MKMIVTGLLITAAAAFSQIASPGIPESGHASGERFFHHAGIAVRLVGTDSVLITVGAGSEDLQNTVRVFPYGDNDTANFRLFERRLESYLMERVPVRVDGKRIYPRVVQWKPHGTGREDRLDMESLYVQNLFITMGARLPDNPKYLDVTANLWIDREDAAETVVQFSFFEGQNALRRLWASREQTIRFPLAPDSLAVLRANPPAPLRPESIQGRLEAPDGHSGHDGHAH